MTDKNCEEFEKWWKDCGSGMWPLPEHDMEEHSRRIAQAAWEASKEGEKQMTTQKPEQMPEHIWVDDMCTAGTREFGGSTQYTRTDLYTAACAEREALRALCEGMAGALSVFLGECQFGGMPPTGKSITAAEDAIIEYLKHKAGE